MHHAFLYISRRHCTITTWKCLISRFVEDVNTRRLYFSFPELRYSPLDFNSRESCQHLINWTRWNKCDKVSSSATSLFKWRFQSCCCRCCPYFPGMNGHSDRSFRSTVPSDQQKTRRSRSLLIRWQKIWPTLESIRFLLFFLFLFFVSFPLSLWFFGGEGGVGGGGGGFLFF